MTQIKILGLKNSLDKNAGLTVNRDTEKYREGDRERGGGEGNIVSMINIWNEKPNSVLILQISDY